MKKIFIDPGHGGSDSGAVGNGLQEKDITLKIALKVKAMLAETYNGYSIKMSRTTDKTVSLHERTRMANNWGAHYLLSIHVNAGGGTGFESFIYNGSFRNKTRTNELRSVIHKNIIEATKFVDRGKKEANFHMLRESNMSAVLTENGFIDRTEDANKLKNDNFLTQIARGHVLGIAKALNLSKKSTGNKQKFYRVISGSFKQKKNAKNHIRDLKNKGFDSFMYRTTVSGEEYFRVVTGSFRSRKNAEKQIKQLKQKGYASFIDVFVTNN